MSTASIATFDSLPKAYETLELLWNFQLDQVEDITSKTSATDPLMGLYRGVAFFLKGAISNTKDSVKMAYEHLRHSHKVARVLAVSETKGTPFQRFLCRLICAETDLFEAALAFKVNASSSGFTAMAGQLGGLLKFRKAWKYYESASKLDKATDMSKEEHYESVKSLLDCGVGFFHFAVGIVPKEFKFIVEGIGFKGNRDQGYAEIKKAADVENGLGTPLAMMHMIWINGFFMQQYEVGAEWLAKTLEKFPLSAHLHYLGAYLHRKFGQIEKSDCALMNTLTFGAALPELVSFTEYDMGYNAYLKLNFKEALGLFKGFLETTPPPPVSYRVYGTFQLGVCYSFTGDKANATACFKKLLPWVRSNFDYDLYAQRWAKRYLKNKGFTEFDKHFLKAMLQDEAWNTSGCQDALMEMAMHVKKKDDQARHTYLFGASLYKSGELDQAKRYFDNCISQEKNISSTVLFVIPFSLLYLAEIALKKDNDLDTAERHLKKVKTYSSYDFSQLCGWRSKNLHDRIKKARKASK